MPTKKTRKPPAKTRRKQSLTTSPPRRKAGTTPNAKKTGRLRSPRPGWTFPALRNNDGCGVAIVVGEQTKGQWDEAVEQQQITSTKRAVGGKPGVSATTCRALAGLGHPMRAKLMQKLLEGPAIYRTLARITKLKPGPLYHHINELRLAGLIRPKQRDLYELTRGGRNLILVAMAVGPLVRDSRRRPQPKVPE